MIYGKTELGLHVLKDRHAATITQRQRSILILFDGKRTLDAVLQATAGLGATPEDVQVLVDGGLVVPADAGHTSAPAAPQAPSNFGELAPASGFSSTLGPLDLPTDIEERQRRYRAAYPIATQLTAQLGLRGFRLNLAVEAAEGYEGLLELMPKIREAIGDARVKPLQRALQGHS
ncbi:MAG: hypothetical protein LCH89_05155 [Proteobacteria bacterium]|nr:hypothetical protein [Pseudomonadota bacterium]